MIVIVPKFMWQRRLHSKEFFGYVESRMVCGNNHWPTVLIRLCAHLRTQFAVLARSGQTIM
jgi:hypothetical protein